MYVKIGDSYYSINNISNSGTVSYITFDKKLSSGITNGQVLDLYSSKASNSAVPNTSSTTPASGASFGSLLDAVFSSSSSSTTSTTPSSDKYSTPSPNTSTTASPIKLINYDFQFTGIITGVTNEDVKNIPLNVGDKVMFNDKSSTGIIYEIHANKILNNQVLYLDNLNYVAPPPTSTPRAPVYLDYPAPYGGFLSEVPVSVAKSLSNGTKVIFNDNSSSGTIDWIDKNTVTGNYIVYLDNLKYVSPTPVPTPTPTHTVTSTPTPTPSPTPTPTITSTSPPPQTTPGRKNYVLHLSNNTSLDNPLFFVPYGDISVDDLKNISTGIVVSPEIFTVREGLGSYGTGQGAGVKAFNECNINSDKSVSGSPSAIDFSKASVLYITDCLSYPIYSAKFKNNTMILQLDTSDTRTINAGYYRIVI
jgi:hypothetical protein